MTSAAETFQRLSSSPFRSRFHLDERDRKYIREKGVETIESHAFDFVHSRLSPSFIPNDGKQTPMKGHPVFKAQHACACCCRGCLEKWYHIPKGRELTPDEERRIVELLMAWIEKEMER